MNLSILDILYRYNHIICSHFVCSFFHLCFQGSFISWQGYFTLWIYRILFIHSSAGGHLDCFHFPLLRIMLLWTFVYKLLCELALLILLSCLDYWCFYQIQMFCCGGHLLICPKIFSCLSALLYTTLSTLPWHQLLLSDFNGRHQWKTCGWGAGEARELHIVLSKVRLNMSYNWYVLSLLLLLSMWPQLLPRGACLISIFCRNALGSRFQ